MMTLPHIKSNSRYFMEIRSIHLLSCLLIAFIFFACVSCSESPEMEKLTLSETLIEERPDSAFAILSGIDKNDLKGKREKAKYALLMSMALDKNYIDTTTFDILQPAIDYYLKKGTPDEKLKTYYYQGRIFQNKGDRENALSSFMKGLDLDEESKDSVLIARTLVAEGYENLNFFNLNNYIESNKKAADIYRDLEDPEHEIDCILNLINGYINCNDQFHADSIIKIVGKLNLEDSRLNDRFKRLKLVYAINFGSDEDISTLLESGYDNLVSDINSILVLAYAHNKLKENDRARELLDYVYNSGTEFDTLKYNAIYVSVLRDVNDYKNALLKYEQFNRLNDSIDYLKFDQKLHTLAEKHQFEMKAQEERQAKSRILWGSICGLVLLAMIIVILILLVRSNKAKKLMAEKREQVKILENSRLKTEQEKLELEKSRLALENENLQLEHQKKVLEAENLAHRVEDLENESETLKNLLKDKDELPEEVRRAIQIRIEMLNSLLASHITDNDQYEKSYDSWVKKITENIDDFMDSNRLAFQATHPKFIKYFEDHGLTTSEINYVCLYAIGLRGKEVGNYIKKRSHVNISSAIRKKLGIDKHDTNLGIYVRKLLKSL